MGKKLLVIICALLFAATILVSLTPFASAEDEKYMWTVAVKCTGKTASLTKKHCGTKQDAISAAKSELKTRESRGCQKIEVVSAEKGEKCN